MERRLSVSLREHPVFSVLVSSAEVSFCKRESFLNVGQLLKQVVGGQ